MKEPTQQPRKTPGTRPAQPSRKLNFQSRVRGSFRSGFDRVLGADIAWSVGSVIAFVLLLSAQYLGSSVIPLSLGETAPADIKAPSEIDVVDEVLTAERRREAAAAQPPVYVHDSGRGVLLARELGNLFEQGRHAMEEGAPVEDGLGPFVAHGFDLSLEHEVKAALTGVMDEMIIGNKALLEREPAISLIRLREAVEQQLEQYDSFIDLAQARKDLQERLERRLMFPRAQETAIIEIVSSFVDTNVQLDGIATRQRRDDAARAVPLAMVRVAQGELLIRKGERVTADALATLEAARRPSSGPHRPWYLLGLTFIASCLAFFLYRYTRYHQRRFRKIKNLHAMVVLMTLFMLTLAEAMLWMAKGVVDNLGSPFDQIAAYTYLIPLGAGPILIALLANGRIAIVYSSFVAFLFGAMNGWDAYLMVWAMLVQCAGVYAISTYRERAALLRAGFVVGGVSAVSVLALQAIQGNLDPGTLGFWYGPLLAFLPGAVAVGLLISFSLPLLEGLFNVLTDIRLLELSNTNNPLLSELAIKAPGSYNHSLVVGTLAEEGAKAIGASSLFCRVAAFYHDIGKMNKAEYYVENQRGSNPHDRLSPSMSALIIASHVKDGIKMAREAGLPEQVVDIIPQHHGTKLMGFFYEKAKRNADPSLGPVKEEDFRYPGPKPQTREAAIFMMADAVEAAARTVEEPTPNRFSDMIRKVTNSIVLDGQLDSCDLTFADLQRIQDAFLRLLSSMYHQRVDYPGFEFGRAKGERKAPDASQERKVARTS